MQTVSETKEITFCDISTRNDSILDTEIMKVVVRFNRNPVDMAEVDSIISELQKVYSKNKSFLVCYDACNITPSLKMAYLKKLKTFADTIEDETRRLVIACAVFMSNPLTTAFVRSIMFIKKPVCKLLICRSLVDAHEFLKVCSHQ